ncbi:MAG: ammonia-forming cytochrome c nitrite reductase subunit c552 [Chitinophagales bacterium]
MKRALRFSVGLAIGIMLLTALAPLVLAAEKPTAIPSILDQTKNSPLGSRHWNIFRKTVTNDADPEQPRCIVCHSAVAMVDDPKATLSDFMKAGQKYAVDEKEDPVTGQVTFIYETAKVDGKYVANDFEGITCRVCHVMDNRGIALRRPTATCTLCHGRTFNWKSGSGHHTEQAFFEGQGDGYWMPSVHYTLGMQCQSCHTMNSIKHDYEPAKAEDIVADAKCSPCHKDAEELDKMIETTKESVEEALKAIDARVKAAGAVKLSDEQKALVKKAKDRFTFIEGELSFGVHNPQFAARMINEAYEALDKAEGKTIPTLKLDLSKLSVFSQAQVSPLGSRHWDMLQRTIFNPADPEQDGCIKCHGAVSILEDPAAKVADFLPKGTNYATGEKEVNGETVFEYGTTTADGKYLSNHMEGITCRVCHTFKGGEIGLVRTAEQTCGLCHGRAFNWNTGSGHHVELAFLKGQGDKALGIEDQPGMKYGMGFACQDCHFMDASKHDYEAATGEQIAANPKCKSCHQSGEEMEKEIKAIQAEVKDGLAKLQPRLAAAKAWVAKNDGNKEAKTLYTQAQAGVNFIVSDYSNGAHNPDFARWILERSGKLLAEFEAKFK